MRFVLQINNNSVAVCKLINHTEQRYDNEIEITEEQFNQIEEFPLKLIIVDGQVTGWEKAMIIPSQEEINQQLNERKPTLIAESKDKLKEYLQSNPLLFTDGKLYSVTSEKQSLLANALQVYQMKIQAGLPATLKWNATGEECTEWIIEDLTALALEIAEYVEPLVAKQQALEVQINNCTTIDELDVIIIDYEVI